MSWLGKILMTGSTICDAKVSAARLKAARDRLKNRRACLLPIWQTCELDRDENKN
jgi:hypothetical protein